MKIRPGTCSSCAASYRMPADFPAAKARCRACGGVVEVSSEIVDLDASAATPNAPAPAAATPSPAAPPTPATAVPAPAPATPTPVVQATPPPSAPVPPAAATPPAPATTVPPAPSPAAALPKAAVPPAAAVPPPTAADLQPEAKAAPRARSRRPEAAPPAKRGIFGFGAPKPEPEPKRERPAARAEQPAAPTAPKAPEAAPPRVEPKPVAEPKPAPEGKPALEAKPAKSETKPIPPAPRAEAKSAPKAEAKPSPKPAAAPQRSAEPRTGAAKHGSDKPSAPKVEEVRSGSALEAILAKNRAESSAPPPAPAKREEPAKKPAAAATSSPPGKAPGATSDTGSTLEKILAKKRAGAETPPTPSPAPKADAKPESKAVPASAAKGGSTLEKILAKKRAEAEAPEELRDEDAIPTRKAVLKASAPAAPNAKGASRAPAKASAAPTKSGAATPARSAAKGSEAGRRRSRDEEGDERGERRRGAPQKSSNGLLYATVGAVVLAGGAIGAIFALGDKKEKEPAPPPIVADASSATSAPPPVAESAPVEAPAVEPGAPKEASAKLEEAPKEPEKPVAKRKFDSALRDGLKPVEGPKPSEKVSVWVEQLNSPIPLSKWDQEEANADLAKEPRAAFAAIHAKLVAIARDQFTPQVAVEGREEMERVVDTFYRYSTTLSALSGYTFDEEETKRMGAMRVAVAGFDPETEAVKVLDELVRAQNACLSHLKRWSELWTEKKLDTTEGWNAFVERNGRGAREDS